MITEPYRSLSGHSSRVTGLSWNQNNTDQLVSASYDGTVQVIVVKKLMTLSFYFSIENNRVDGDTHNILNDF